MGKMSKQPRMGSLVGNQRGFTLIELIVVIVVLGLLSAVAIPKYQDIKSDAQNAAASGVFGAASGATAVNFAGTLLNKGNALITNASTLAGAIDGGLPVGWGADATTANNAICSNGTTTAVTTAGCMTTAKYSIIVSTAETANTKAILTKGGTATAGSW